MWNTCAAFDRAAVDDGSNDVVGCVAEHARRPTSAVVLPQLARLIPHHNGLTDGCIGSSSRATANSRVRLP